MKGFKLFLVVATAALLSACNNAGEIVKKSGHATLYKKGTDTTLRDSTRLWDKAVEYQYKDCEGNLKTGIVYRPGSWAVKTREFKLRGDSVIVDSGCVITAPVPPKKGYRERVVDNANGSNGFWPAVGTILAILLGLALIIGAIMLLFWLLQYLWEALSNRRRPESTHVTQSILPGTPPAPASVKPNEQPAPPPATVVNHYHFYGSSIINESTGTVTVTDNSKRTENRNGGSGTFNNGTLT